MKFINQIQEFIQQLDNETLKKYLIILIIIITFIMGFITYYIYNKNSSLLQQINDLETQTLNTKAITSLYQKNQDQKNAITSLLDKEKDFEIKSFFEAFCKDQNLKVNSTWKTTSAAIDGNEKLEEISLKASSKNLTMEKLIKILESLNSKEIVYIKDIQITKNTNKTIDIDLTIATFKYK